MWLNHRFEKLWVLFIEEQQSWYVIAYWIVSVIYFYSQAPWRLVADDADSWSLDVVSYDTWNWNNTGNNIGNLINTTKKYIYLREIWN